MSDDRLAGHEERELEQALFTAWADLQEALLVLEGWRSNTPRYEEALTAVEKALERYQEVIARLKQRASQ